MAPRKITYDYSQNPYCAGCGKEFTTDNHEFFLDRACLMRLPAELRLAVLRTPAENSYLVRIDALKALGAEYVTDVRIPKRRKDQVVRRITCECKKPLLVGKLLLGGGEVISCNRCGRDIA